MTSDYFRNEMRSSCRRKTRKLVIGLSWKKLPNLEDVDDEENSSSEENTQGCPFKDHRPTPVGDDVKHIENSPLGIDQGSTFRKLTRAMSFRAKDAFGTIKQKIRASTRRKSKRLLTQSPYPSSRQNTPGSSCRRSERLAYREGVKLFSPFSIETPEQKKTPSRIRMGIHEPRRFNFSSPGKFKKQLSTVSEGISALNQMSENLNKATNRQPGSGIRTTPRRSKAGPKSAIFV